MADPAPDATPAEQPVRRYRLVSAKYRDKEYPEGVLTLDVAQRQIELTRSAGKGKKEDALVARFRVEDNAETKLDGPVLRVSELYITLASPGDAGELAELLVGPLARTEAARLLSAAESSMKAFLVAREETLAILSRMRVDLRGAVLSAGSMVPEGYAGDPVVAIRSACASRLSGSLAEASSSLEGSESRLGPAVVERLCAVAYTIGAVQDSLFDGGSDLSLELAALQELGISATEEDLRMERLAERMMERAHPALDGVGAPRPGSG